MINTSILKKRVRSVFRKLRWKNILTFSLFLILASIFWLMQVYRQEFESTVFVPISYENVPDSIVFTNTLPTHIDARITDDGINLFRYSAKEDSLTINIGNELAKFSSNIISTQNLEDLVRSAILLKSSKLISCTPSHIELNHEILSKKALPVLYKGSIDIASGYILDGDILVVPDTVYAYGAKSVLDTIDYAYTLSDTIHDLKSSQSIAINFAPIESAVLKPNKVWLTVPLDKFTLKELMIPVKCINLPEHLKIRFFPSAVKLPFYVGLDRYEEIRADDFKVIIDYNEISSDQIVSSASIQILQTPSYIRLMPAVPSDVEFVLELN